MDKQRVSELTATKLSRLKAPSVPTGQHAMQLKQTLLAASRPAAINKPNKWENIMSLVHTKKLLIPGAFASFVVVALLAASFVTINKPVSAAELAQKSFTSVAQLTPEAKQAMDNRLKADAGKELQLAKQATNLKSLSYEDARTLPSFAMALNVPGEAQPNTNLKDLRYLTFTDSQGATHLIGLGNKELPELIIVSNNKDGVQQSTFQMQGSRGETITGGSVSAGSDGSVQPNSEGISSCTPTQTSGLMECTAEGAAPLEN